MSFHILIQTNKKKNVGVLHLLVSVVVVVVVINGVLLKKRPFCR